MRKEYQMSKEQLSTLLRACQPVPCMMTGGMPPRSPQENANDTWADLGREMGFKPMTVRPVPGKGQEYFTAEPNETEGQ